MHRSRMRNVLACTQIASLHRTQEVGGSNSPSSIDSNLLQIGTFAFDAPF
jgi:hypothetical protein